MNFESYNAINLNNLNLTSQAEYNTISPNLTWPT